MQRVRYILPACVSVLLRVILSALPRAALASQQSLGATHSMRHEGMSVSLCESPNRSLPYSAPSPVRYTEGIYRYRYLVDGRPLWFAVNAVGEIVGLRIVRKDQDEADAVAELVELLRGPEARKPKLTVVPRSSSSPRLSATAASVLLLLRKL